MLRKTLLNFSPSITFNSLIPEMYVMDFEKSLDFYTNVLGFKIEYQRKEPQFAFLSHLGSQLMIQLEDDNEEWHNAKPKYPFGRGLNFQITTHIILQLYENLKAINYPLKRGLKDSWYQVNDALYGCIEFLVMDIDGYLLRFSQPMWSLHLSEALDLLIQLDDISSLTCHETCKDLRYLIASYVYLLPDANMMPTERKARKTLQILHKEKSRLLTKCGIFSLNAESVSTEENGCIIKTSITAKL